MRAAIEFVLRWACSDDSGISGVAVAQSSYRMRIKMEEKIMEDSERMKILIAYDGSEGAESAIEDLMRAGLPRRAEAIVMTIAEELIPAPTSIGGVATTFGKNLLEEEKDSMSLARRARSRIQELFPGWEILAEAGIGSPGSEIIAKADEWRPDLIVVGSHGRTALGRLFFGSVSQKVINAAHCSVRVARGRIVEPDAPARIIVGVDGSEEADAAVDEIASRDWPDGSEVRIVNSAWTIPAASDPGTAVNLAEWIARETERVNKVLEGAAEKLGSAGVEGFLIVEKKEAEALLCGGAGELMAGRLFVRGERDGTARKTPDRQRVVGSRGARPLLGRNRQGGGQSVR